MKHPVKSEKEAIIQNARPRRSGPSRTEERRLRGDKRRWVVAPLLKWSTCCNRQCFLQQKKDQRGISSFFVCSPPPPPSPSVFLGGGGGGGGGGARESNKRVWKTRAESEDSPPSECWGHADTDLSGTDTSFTPVCTYTSWRHTGEHTHARARTHVHARARTHTHTLTRPIARTHTHAHTQ